MTEEAEAALIARPRTLDFDAKRAALPDLLTLCDCPWHPCSHNGPKRDWRFHLLGRWPLGPTARGQRRAPRARGIWRRLGSVQAVESGQGKDQSMVHHRESGESS